MEALKRFYSKHPVWSWVIIVFVGLAILGAALPSEDSPDSQDGEQASGQRDKPTGKPEVQLVVESVGGNYVKRPFARLRGIVEATNAKGEAAEGAVSTVWIGGLGSRDVSVREDGSFTTKVPLRSVGNHDVEVYAEWPGGGASDTVSLELVRELSKAEIAARKARRRARAEAKRQELINSAQPIDYDQLMKSPESYAGDPVKYYRQIFQIQEDPLGGGIMLLSVTDEGYGFWTDEVWVNYTGKVEGAEDDFVTVYGRVVGSKSYETQIGGARYVPEIDAVIVDG